MATTSLHAIVKAMGFFDEFNDFVGEISSLKSEFTGITESVVKDVTTSAKGVKKTVSDTATELKTSASDIKSTLQSTTKLEPVKESTDQPTDLEK